jgi:hypothetical protein
VFFKIFAGSFKVFVLVDLSKKENVPTKVDI